MVWLSRGENTGVAYYLGVGLNGALEVVMYCFEVEEDIWSRMLMLMKGLKAVNYTAFGRLKEEHL